jgi:hypothetical protein
MQLLRAGHLQMMHLHPPTLQAHTFYQSWERRLEVAAGAAAGLFHMHSKGVIHRDLTRCVKQCTPQGVGVTRQIP